VKRILPGKNVPQPREKDVQTTFSPKAKPYQVKDHEERKR
jgi:hypothetical protein